MIGGILSAISNIAKLSPQLNIERAKLAQNIAQSRILNALTLATGLLWFSITFNILFIGFYPPGTSAELILSAQEQLLYVLGLLVAGKGITVGMGAKYKKQLNESIITNQELKEQNRREEAFNRRKKSKIKHAKNQSGLSRPQEQDRLVLVRDYVPPTKKRPGITKGYIYKHPARRTSPPEHEVLCYAAELEWRHNEQSVSCIPEGFYNLKLVKQTASGKLKNVLYLEGVAARTGIFIHPAGGKKPLKEYIKGCIVPLSAPVEIKGRKWFAKDGASSEGMNAVLSAYNQGFKMLEIKS